MNAQILLNDLTGKGFTIRKIGDSLEVSPISKLSDEDRGLIVKAKPELLELLSTEPEASGVRYTPAQRLARQPKESDQYLTDSGTKVDLSALLDQLEFVCKGRSITPLDLGSYLDQTDLDRWARNKLLAAELRDIADDCEQHKRHQFETRE